ncbi:MAG: NAD(P)H-hydrate epimerase [Planctomycetota bacterium]|nr:NAD(P)H-hydrate epimerase [Planctomycetota bacterium]
MESFSRDQVRSVDRYAIRQVGVPGVVLMENAGRRAADEIERFLGEAAGKSVAIVAGAGNNGGDGFVIARHLAMRGIKVVTFIVASPEKISGDAEINLNILRKLDHDVRDATTEALKNLTGAIKSFDVVVDAVGGTGIQGALRGDIATAVEQINAAGLPVVAIDIPTGLDCDTGLAAGPTVKAALTVTMLACKKGFDAEGAAAYTGEVRVVDIGIPAEVVRGIAEQEKR